MFCILCQLNLQLITKRFSTFRLPFSLQLPAEDIDERVRSIFKINDGEGVMLFNVSEHEKYIATSASSSSSASLI